MPEQYPLVPPAVRFKTKIFHPNVHFRVSRGKLWMACQPKVVAVGKGPVRT